jgi:hypothetical protein
LVVEREKKRKISHARGVNNIGTINLQVKPVSVTNQKQKMRRTRA